MAEQSSFSVDEITPQQFAQMVSAASDHEDHLFAVPVRDGTCRIERATADSPKTTLAMDLVSFARLTDGQAQGTQLFMTGKLKVSGDLMFATLVPGSSRLRAPSRGSRA